MGLTRMNAVVVTAGFSILEEDKAPPERHAPVNTGFDARLGASLL